MRTLIKQTKLDKRLMSEGDIHLSIVSHGQWPMILQLLNDLTQLSEPSRFQLTITLNIKEPYELALSQFPFAITVIENAVAKGFGANHNAAFHSPPDKSQRKFFVVINPDIRIFENIFTVLTNIMDENQQQKTGVIAPEINNPEGHVEDSARELPTPGKLVEKLLGRKVKRWQYKEGRAYQPDWVAGMFMLFKVEVFELTGGFNERYFLYYEDVELCSRLWLAGYPVVVEPSVSVVHNARRTSHRNLKYFRWHLTSILRFFLSSVYRQAKQLHKTRIPS